MHRYFWIRRVYRLLMIVSVFLPRWWQRAVCIGVVFVLLKYGYRTGTQMVAQETRQAIEYARSNTAATVVAAMGVPRLPLPATVGREA